MLSPLNAQAVVVIDMNGKVVKQWDGFNNSAGGPARVPGGVVMAANGARRGVRSRWSSFARFRRQGDMEVRSQPRDPDPRRKDDLVARQHHDWQREDSRPVTTRRRRTCRSGRQHAGPDTHRPQRAGRSPA